MRHIAFCLLVMLCAAASSPAVDFLGIELCEGSVDTSVVLPVGSPLSLQSAEIGGYGDLLLLLTAENGDIMDHIDDLMSFYTGTRGTGDAKKLQWAGNQITAYAQLIKEGYAALAVSTTDTCPEGRSAAPAAPAATMDAPSPETVTQPQPETAAGPEETTEVQAVEAAAAVVAATAADVDEIAATDETVANLEAEPATGDQNAAPVVPGEPEPSADFVLKGALKHAAAEGGWVDVMGVVVNNSGTAYAVASFDLSLYDASGNLICVDTISVNQLRIGQERAFRGAIRCADYDPAVVASWKLQFAGAH